MHNIIKTSFPSLGCDEHLPKIDQPSDHSAWEHSTVSSYFDQPCTFSEHISERATCLTEKSQEKPIQHNVIGNETCFLSDFNSLHHNLIDPVDYFDDSLSETFSTPVAKHEANIDFSSKKKNMDTFGSEKELSYKDIISEDLLAYLLRHNEIISSHVHHLDGAIRNSAEVSSNKIKFTTVKLLLEGENINNILTYLSRRHPSCTHLPTIERLSIMLECYLLGGLKLLRGFKMDTNSKSLSIELMQFILNLLESNPNYSLLTLQHTLRETINKGEAIPYVNISELPDLSDLYAFIRRSGYKKNPENKWILDSNLTSSYPDLSLLELLSFSDEARVSTDSTSLGSNPEISFEPPFLAPSLDFVESFADEFLTLNTDTLSPISEEETTDLSTPPLDLDPDFAEFFMSTTNGLLPISTTDEEVTASSLISSLDFLELIEDELPTSHSNTLSPSPIPSPIPSLDFLELIEDELLTSDTNTLSPTVSPVSSVDFTTPAPISVTNEVATALLPAPSSPLADECVTDINTSSLISIANEALPLASSSTFITPLTDEIALNQNANALPFSAEEKAERENTLVSFLNSEPEPPEPETPTQTNLNAHGKKALNAMLTALVDKDNFSVNLEYLKQLREFSPHKYYETMLAARCLRYQITRTQFKQAMLDTIIFPNRRHRIKQKLNNLAKAKLEYFNVQCVFDTNQEHIFPLGKSKQDLHKAIRTAQESIAKCYPRLKELDTQYEKLRDSKEITTQYLESFFKTYIEKKESEDLFLSLLSDDIYQEKTLTTTATEENHEAGLSTDDKQTDSLHETSDSSLDDPILSLHQDFSDSSTMINGIHALLSTEGSTDRAQVIDVNALPVINMSDLKEVANQADIVSINFQLGINSEKNGTQQSLLTFEPINNNNLLGLNIPTSKIDRQKRKASESGEKINRNKIQKIDNKGISFKEIQGLNAVDLPTAKNNYDKEIAHLKSAIENEYERDTDKTKFVLVKMLLEGIPEEKLFEHFELICKTYQTARINLIRPERIRLMRDYYFAGGLKLLRCFSIGSHPSIHPASLINFILETIENDDNRSIRTGLKVLEHIKSKMATRELPADIDFSALPSPSSIDRFIKHFGYKKDLKRHLIFNNKLTQPNKV